ncbi:hypothetical protein HOY80DRAFT_1135253 [Tuber brumale]|nr:hypothetical protein HOY80DRAFT_1135253 [Tuber brumale]
MTYDRPPIAPLTLTSQISPLPPSPPPEPPTHTDPPPAYDPPPACPRRQAPLPPTSYDEGARYFSNEGSPERGYQDFESEAEAHRECGLSGTVLLANVLILNSSYGGIYGNCACIGSAWPRTANAVDRPPGTLFKTHAAMDYNVAAAARGLSAHDSGLQLCNEALRSLARLGLPFQEHANGDNARSLRTIL